MLLVSGCSGGYPDGSHRTVGGGYSAGPSQCESVSSPPVSQKDDRVNLHYLDVFAFGMSSCWHGHAAPAGLAWARGKETQQWLVDSVHLSPPCNRGSPISNGAFIHCPSFVPCLLYSALLLPVLHLPVGCALSLCIIYPSSCEIGKPGPSPASTGYQPYALCVAR